MPKSKVGHAVIQVVWQCRSFDQPQYFAKENPGTLEIRADEDEPQ